MGAYAPPAPQNCFLTNQIKSKKGCIGHVLVREKKRNSGRIKGGPGPQAQPWAPGGGGDAPPKEIYDMK